MYQEKSQHASKLIEHIDILHSVVKGMEAGPLWEEHRDNVGAKLRRLYTFLTSLWIEMEDRRNEKQESERLSIPQIDRLRWIQDRVYVLSQALINTQRSIDNHDQNCGHVAYEIYNDLLDIAKER